MVKRAKKIRKGIESLKKEIEKHIEKIEEDIKEKKIDRGRYHIKEVNKSLLTALKLKIELLGVGDNDSVKAYQKRLEKLKKSLELNELI